LETGICSRAELQVSSCYRGCKKISGDARDFKTRSRVLASRFFFPAEQGAEGDYLTLPMQLKYILKGSSSN
jgi:hypothetical protein